tara:strand:- start:176 stop:490 length:315 start_codon:yes stop_codon:yes gene_type:complete
MEEQIPSNQPEQQRFTPEMLEQLKRQAKDLAIQQALQQRLAVEQSQNLRPDPSKATKVVVRRRNLTLAELLVMLAVSCGLVFGLQSCWNYTSNILPKIEVKIQR